MISLINEPSVHLGKIKIVKGKVKYSNHEVVLCEICGYPQICD